MSRESIQEKRKRIKIAAMSALAASIAIIGNADDAPIFDAPLVTTLRPNYAAGSYTATFTRATTKYVLGYAAGAVIADGPTLIACASGEASFWGARRVSEGVWSAVDANGVALTTTNGASALCCDARGPYGYLAEGARTNLCLYSEDLTNAAWTKSAVSITSNAVVAPDGTTTMDKIVEAASGGKHECFQAFTVTADTTYTISAHYKAGERTSARLLWCIAAEASGCSVDINLTSGTLSGGTAFGTGTYTGSTITALPGGIYRVTLTGKLDAASTTGYIDHQPLVGGTATYVGDGTSGFYEWGTQLEAASFASSYIPTTTAAVTRNADRLYYARAGNFVTAEGAITCETGPIEGLVNGGPIFVGVGGADAALYYPSAVALGAFDGTTPVSTPAVDDITANSNKVGVRFSASAGSYQGFANGSAGTAVAFDGTLNGGNVYIGGTSGRELFGPIRFVKSYGRYPSAATMQGLTTP